MGSPIPTRCDRCGAPLLPGAYKRVRADRHSGTCRPGKQWLTDEFRRYYCTACAEEVKKAIRRCEMEGGE